MPELERDSENFDPHSRRLCPDGSCIGVIGGDGRCKVCGTADRPGSAGLESFSGGSAAEANDEADMAAEPEGDGLEALSFDPGRKLCVDGSCIGVIGPDGRCTECGRSTDG
jgi:hypothetical protein